MKLLGFLLGFLLSVSVNGQDVKNTIEDLRAHYPTVSEDFVETLGYYEKFDGGANVYEYIEDSTLSDNGGSVISTMAEDVFAVSKAVVYNVSKWGAMDESNSIGNTAERLNAMSDWFFDNGIQFAPVFSTGSEYILEAPIEFNFKNDKELVYISCNSVSFKAKDNSEDFDLIQVNSRFLSENRYSLANTNTDISSFMGMFSISGVEFYHGRNAINAIGVFNFKVEGCKFWRNHRSVYARFCLNTMIDGNTSTFNRRDAFLIEDSGSSYYDSWGFHPKTTKGAGATQPCVINSNRIFSYPTAETDIKIINCSGVLINTCIFEGAKPDVRIYAKNSTNTGIGLTVSNCHFEAEDDEYLFYFDNIGTAKISMANIQLGGKMFFKKTGVIWESDSWRNSGTKFESPDYPHYNVFVDDGATTIDTSSVEKILVLPGAQYYPGYENKIISYTDTGFVSFFPDSTFSGHYAVRSFKELNTFPFRKYVYTYNYEDSTWTYGPGEQMKGLISNSVRFNDNILDSSNWVGGFVPILTKWEGSSGWQSYRIETGANLDIVSQRENIRFFLPTVTSPSEVFLDINKNQTTVFNKFNASKGLINGSYAYLYGQIRFNGPTRVYTPDFRFQTIKNAGFLYTDQFGIVKSKPKGNYVELDSQIDVFSNRSTIEDIIQVLVESELIEVDPNK